MTPTVGMAPLREMQLLGRELEGRWMVEERLCKGGMGEIYVGRQLSIDRLVAIKLMREDISHEPQLMARFFRESKALSSLHHPNIVTMFDFGQDDETGSLFMVMELLKGSSLAEVLKTGYTFTLLEILKLMVQLVGALGEAHDNKIIHRDLKPQNLFLESLPGGGFHLKVLDFGIAVHDEPQMSRLTETGQLQGTPHYMAPEQIEGDPVSPQTDLYTVGIVLYELLSGMLPFEGETMIEVLFNSIHESPKSLADAWGCEEPRHEGLLNLVEQLLEKNPARRPASASVVCEQLRIFQRELDQPPHEVSMAEPLLRVCGPLHTPVTMTPEAWPAPSLQIQKALTPVITRSPPEALSETEGDLVVPGAWSHWRLFGGSSASYRMGSLIVSVTLLLMVLFAVTTIILKDDINVESSVERDLSVKATPTVVDSPARPSPEPEEARVLAVGVRERALKMAKTPPSSRPKRPTPTPIKTAPVKKLKAPETAGDERLRRLLREMRKP